MSAALWLATGAAFALVVMGVHAAARGAARMGGVLGNITKTVAAGEQNERRAVQERLLPN